MKLANSAIPEVVAIWKVTSIEPLTLTGADSAMYAGATTMEIPMARPRRNLTTVKNHTLGASPCRPANAA